MAVEFADFRLRMKALRHEFPTAEAEDLVRIVNDRRFVDDLREMHGRETPPQSNLRGVEPRMGILDELPLKPTARELWEESADMTFDDSPWASPVAADLNRRARPKYPIMSKAQAAKWEAENNG